MENDQTGKKDIIMMGIGWNGETHRRDTDTKETRRYTKVKVRVNRPGVSCMGLRKPKWNLLAFILNL